MRVLIYQQFHLGHHYQYVAFLLPELVRVVDKVIVAITPAGQASAEYQSFLAPFEDRVTFAPVVPPASPGTPLSERWRTHRDLRRLVWEVGPDYVLIPSGDAQTTMMAPWRLSGAGALPGHIPCEVGIHFGLGSAASGFSTKVKDGLFGLDLALSGARRIHLVNFMFYEGLRLPASLRAPFSLMPHPVGPNPRLGKGESRRALGLPEEGRYLGLAASIDSRKAVRELLQAFRAATSLPTDRLVLAGSMNGTHLRTIEDTFGDLVATGRLIVRNEFLSPKTYQTVLSALDVVCTPYPSFMGLSATLLEGLAAGRPVLTNSEGWCEAVTRRFSAGWSCNMRDDAAFTKAIAMALERAGDYVEPSSVKRLLEFHSPQNFAANWLESICQVSGRSSIESRSWAWACQETVPTEA